MYGKMYDFIGRWWNRNQLKTCTMDNAKNDAPENATDDTKGAVTPSIEKFNATSMTKYPVIVIIGKRRAGKTTLSKDIVRKLKFEKVVVGSFYEKWEDSAGECLRPEGIIDAVKEQLKKVENGSNESMMIVALMM